MATDDVAGIFNHMPQLLEPRFKTSHAHRRRSHINPAARLAKIERHPNNADLLGSDVRSGNVSSHGLAD